MSLDSLIRKGNQCLEERENIPSAPIWHMGKVAVFSSKPSFDLLQNTIDYLTCKAKLKKPFTKNEKEFMKELYEAMWWGGNYRGYREAAKLANHYVNGGGKSIAINPNVYKTSVIVTDTMETMKSYIKDQIENNHGISFLRSNDPKFLRSTYISSLTSKARNYKTQGLINLKKGGVILSEQLNPRLKNTDNQFHLSVNVLKHSKKGSSSLVWKVKSIYDFEAFEKNNITDLSLAEGFTLKLHDGLSQYLTQIGVANVFNYSATWFEKVEW